jgi:hypothetical protein
MPSHPERALAQTVRPFTDVPLRPLEAAHRAECSWKRNGGFHGDSVAFQLPVEDSRAVQPGFDSRAKPESRMTAAGILNTNRESKMEDLVHA